LIIAPLGQELVDVRASLRLQDDWIRIENLEVVISRVQSRPYNYPDRPPPQGVFKVRDGR
jgi:hypothetical protein